MKHLNKRFKAALMILSLALIGLSTGWWMTTESEAQNPRRAHFGMFGINDAQFARLNVANVCSPLDPCRSRTLRLTFLNADGSSGGGGGVDSPLTQTVVTIEPGRSAFFDVPGALFAGAGSRAQIRAVVEDLGAPNVVPPNPTIPTLEVVDIATNTTVFHVGPYTNWGGCGGSNPFF